MFAVPLFTGLRLRLLPTAVAKTVLVRVPRVFDVTSKLKEQEAPALRVAPWRVIVAAVPEAPMTATDPPVQVVEGAVSLRYRSPETGLFRLSGTLKLVICDVVLLVMVTVARLISPCLIVVGKNDLARVRGSVTVTVDWNCAALLVP